MVMMGVFVAGVSYNRWGTFAGASYGAGRDVMLVPLFSTCQACGDEFYSNMAAPTDEVQSWFKLRKSEM